MILGISIQVTALSGPPSHFTYFTLHSFHLFIMFLLFYFTFTLCLTHSLLSFIIIYYLHLKCPFPQFFFSFLSLSSSISLLGCLVKILGMCSIFKFDNVGIKNVGIYPVLLRSAPLKSVHPSVKNIVFEKEGCLNRTALICMFQYFAVIRYQIPS